MHLFAIVHDVYALAGCMDIHTDSSHMTARLAIRSKPRS